MLKSFKCFIKLLATSRTVQIVVVVHWLLLIVALIQKGGIDLEPTLSTIRAPEPFLFQILFLLNLPAIFVALVPPIIFGFLANLLPSSALLMFNDWQSYVLLYLLFIICISFQWALIGYLIEKMLRRNPKYQ